MATISVQILSEGDEKALINPRMVINDKLRKHFQMQMQVSLPNISDLVKNFELKRDILTICLFRILLIDRYNFVHFHRVKV